MVHIQIKIYYHCNLFNSDKNDYAGKYEFLALGRRFCTIKQDRIMPESVKVKIKNFYILICPYKIRSRTRGAIFFR